jgi:hypothetical protein
MISTGFSKQVWSGLRFRRISRLSALYNFYGLVDGSAKSPAGWEFSSEEFGRTPYLNGYPLVLPVDVPGIYMSTERGVASGTHRTRGGVEDWYRPDQRPQKGACHWGFAPIGCVIEGSAADGSRGALPSANRSQARA